MMMSDYQLSALHRNEYLQKARSQEFDVVIIGGGITGAGIALDAASRGLTTLLVEMQDFGAGTSSRSTKLIHGGLRYLKQLEINLVREVGRERAIIHENAPHIVVPKKMLLPIIENGSLGKYGTSLGLFVYDKLAGVDADEQRKMQSKEATAELEPLLRTDILQGGGLYYEYQTDDGRLTIEVLKTAAKYGAISLSYVKAVGLEYEEERAVGVQLMDMLTDEQLTVRAKVIVNAAGPWVDELRKKDNSLNDKRLHLTKGVHIVVPYDRLPLQQAAYFDVPDGRMIFAIPRNEVTYIGTTDTTYTKSPKRPQADIDDVTYLLAGVNNLFPTVNLQVEDVVSTWAGVRPLIHQEGKSPSELSRKDEIFYSKSGLVSIAGGKLTGFRKMAERTVDVVMKELYKRHDRSIESCSTDDIIISGGHFDDPENLPNYITALTDAANTANNNLQLTEKQVHHLVYKYGTNTPMILEFAAADERRLPIEQKLLLAEVRYGVACEMVHTLSDFAIRRTGRLYFERNELDDCYHLILDELERLLSMSKQEKLQQLNDFEEEFEAVVAFKNTLQLN